MHSSTPRVPFGESAMRNRHVDASVARKSRLASASPAPAHGRFCNTCHKKFSLCGCKVEITAEERRKRMNSISNPFEMKRAQDRQARIYARQGKLMEIEGRERVAMENNWYDAIQEIAGRFSTLRNLGRCINEEVDDRLYVASEWRRETETLRFLGELSKMSAYLLEAENFERREIVGEEMIMYQHIEDLHMLVRDRFDIFMFENQGRTDTMHEQRKTWSDLLDFEVNARAQMTRDGRARKELSDHEAVYRDELYYEEANIRQDLQNAYVQISQELLEFEDERQELLIEETEFSREIYSAEAAEFLLLVELFEEESEEIQKMLREHKSERIALQQKFEKSLLQFCSYEQERREKLAAKFAADYDNVIEAIEKKRRVRQQAYDYVLQEFGNLENKEVAERAQLMTAFDEELQQRKRWIESKKEARRDFCNEVFGRLQDIYRQAVAEYHPMWEQMLDEEDMRREWIREKLQERKVSADGWLKEKWELFDEQTDVRASLYERMLDEEENLHQWIEDLYAVRNSVAADEMVYRRDLEEEQAAHFDDIFNFMQEKEDEICKYLEAKAAERRKCSRDLLNRIDTLIVEEEAAFEAIQLAAVEDLELANANGAARERNGVYIRETAQREVLLESEMKERSAVKTQFAFAIEQMSRRHRETWARIIGELETDESLQRSIIDAAARDELLAIGVEERQNRELAVREEEEQKKAGYAAMQAYLQEDERLYTEEDPISDGRMSIIAARESIGFTDNREQREMKLEFLSGELGEEKHLQQLDLSQLEAITTLLECFAAKEWEANNKREQAHRQLETQTKVLEKARHRAEHSRETRDFYRNKSRTDASEHENRLQGEKDTTRKQDMDLKNAKKRVAETTQDLKDKEEELAQLKESLHQAMRRR